MTKNNLGKGQAEAQGAGGEQAGSRQQWWWGLGAASTSNSGLELVTFSSNFLRHERIEPRDSACKMSIYSSPLLH